jgi:hypothetical protein
LQERPARARDLLGDAVCLLLLRVSGFVNLRLRLNACVRGAAHGHAAEVVAEAGRVSNGRLGGRRFVEAGALRPKGRMQDAVRPRE